MVVPVLTPTGERKGEMAVPDGLAQPKASPHVLWQVSTAQQADRRVGSASTLRRSEVSGGGAKPWRQKGTGRARHGSRRSPIWKGGGVAHGPKPRDWRMGSTQKMRRHAFALALAEKLRDERVVVVDPLTVEDYDVKLVLQLLENVKAGKRTLVLLQEPDGRLYKSAGNLRRVKVRLLPTVELREVLWAESVLLSPQAAQALFEEGARWRVNGRS